MSTQRRSVPGSRPNWGSTVRPATTVMAVVVFGVLGIKLLVYGLIVLNDGIVKAFEQMKADFLGIVSLLTVLFIVVFLFAKLASASHRS